MAKGVRIQTTVREPLGEKIKRMAEEEGRSESDMAERLLDEAVRDREAKSARVA